jgi:hypothetical protein
MQVILGHPLQTAMRINIQTPNNKFITILLHVLNKSMKYVKLALITALLAAISACATDPNRSKDEDHSHHGSSGRHSH